MIETATFTCSICSEPSTTICVYCTKDACANHRCERCNRCSDCCECEVPLTAPQHAMVEPPMAEPAMAEAQSTEPDFPEPDVGAEHFLDVGEQRVEQPDSAWLTPPEATEEPDLNPPPAPVVEHAVEQDQHEEKARPFPTNSTHGVPEGAD